MFFFFFDDEHPYTIPTSESLGVYKVKSLTDYIRAKDHLKKLKALYDQMGQEKEEVDDEAEAVSTAILEQEKQIDDFVASINVFDSKYLSNNLEHLLKQNHMKVSELEALLNVSAGYISRTMGADSKKRISIDIVWMIAQVFNANIDDLLNRDLTAPTKDLKKVISFVQKLATETNEESLHWQSHGNKPTRETEYFFRTENGQATFAPNGEKDDFYEIRGIYSVRINIGKIYLVELENIFNELSFRFYLFNEEDYYQSQGSGYEIEPLVLMIDSGKDKTEILNAECGKLRNSIKTHEKDFVVSDQTRSLLEQYLNPQVVLTDEDMPFS